MAGSWTILPLTKKPAWIPSFFRYVESSFVRGPGPSSKVSASVFGGRDSPIMLATPMACVPLHTRSDAADGCWQATTSTANAAAAIAQDPDVVKRSMPAVVAKAGPFG